MRHSPPRFIRALFAGAIVCASVVSVRALAQTGLQFDGASQYVTFGAAPSLGAASFTIECWFKPLGAGATSETGSGGLLAYPLVSKGRGEADGGTMDMNYFLGIDPATWRLVVDFEEGTGSSSPGLNHPLTGVTSVLPGVWSHAAATYDTSSRSLRLYLNGVLEAQAALSPSPLFPQYLSIQHAALGTAINTLGEVQGYFNGVIDEARIWGIARSQQSINDSMMVEVTGNAAGLLGRWGLNEGSGSAAGNSVSGGVNGTLVGGPTWTTGSPFAAPGGLGFGGNGSYVTFGQVPSLGLKTFTVECWFKKTGAGITANTGVGGVDAVPLVTKGRGEADVPRNVNANYFLGIAGNVLAADFEDTTTGLNHPLVGNAVLASNQWYHGAVTYDGTSWRMYVNGELDTSLTVGAVPEYTSIQHSALGSALNSSGVSQGYLQGFLDEVRIWDYARTTAEIRSTINTKLGSAQPGLLARWALDERAGTSVSGSAGTTVNGTIIGTIYGWCEAAPFNLEVNDPPAAPVAIAPLPGATGVGTSPTLSAQVSDPDNATVTVQFFGRPASSGSYQLLGTQTGVPSGSTASIVWPGLSTGTQYLWYVTVGDGEFTTTGTAWDFTTVLSYTITVTQTPNGTIAPGTTTVTAGSNQTFTITPDPGYSIGTLTVDGSPVAPAGTFTFTNVTANHTITATYTINSYTITPTAGANGNISPSTPQVVTYGSTPQFTMTGSGGYHLAALLIDGTPVNPVSPYTFAPVSADHTIHARFAQTQYTIDHTGLYSFDTNADGTTDMTMDFTVLPSGGGHVSIYMYLTAPPAEQPGPAGSLGYYVIIVCDMPDHSFSVTVKSDMAAVAGYGSTTNLVYYHSASPAGWVLMPMIYAATDPDFGGHASLSFTTDHFSNFTVFNGASKNLYVSLAGTTASAGTVYPGNSWTSGGYGADDWQWTGSQALSFYLVPELNSVFKDGDVTLEWDNSVMTYAGVEWTGLGFTAQTATQTGNQLRLQVSAAGDITVNPLSHIAKVNFTLLRPGHSALAVVQGTFTKADLSAAYLIPHQGEVKAYLADVGSASAQTTGDGLIDFNDLVPWSIAYWSGVPGFPGGMTNYKKKYDFGPTQNGYIFTLPVPDSKIAFEDLLILSIAYGQSQSHQLPRAAPLSGEPLEVSLGRPVVSGADTRVPVMIGGEVRDVRGMSITVDGTFGEFLGAEKGDLLESYETPVLVMARADARAVYVDCAVLGLGEPGVARPGDVVWLKFRGTPTLRLDRIEARNSANAVLAVQKKRGDGETLPASTALEQNYPNPFNPTADIGFRLADWAHVTITVYDLLGRRVVTLVDETRAPGVYSVTFNAEGLAGGVYICRMQAGTYTAVRKMMLLR